MKVIDLEKYYGIDEKHKPINLSVDRDTVRMSVDDITGDIDITIYFITELQHERKIPLGTSHKVQRLENRIKEAVADLDYGFDRDCHLIVEINSIRRNVVLSQWSTAEVIARSLFQKDINKIKSITVKSGKVPRNTKSSFCRIKIIET